MADSALTIGRYRLQKQLGTGGMGDVFLAQQEGAEGVTKLVAIKRVHPRLSRDPKFVRMFVDEARIAVHLSHSNIAAKSLLVLHK